MGESLQLVSLLTPASLLPLLLRFSTCQVELTWIRSLGVGCVGGHSESQRWYGVCRPLCDFI